MLTTGENTRERIENGLREARQTSIRLLDRARISPANDGFAGPFEKIDVGNAKVLPF